MKEKTPFTGLDLDDLQPSAKELKFRGRVLLLPHASPIPTIMAAVALQEELREIVGRIEEMVEPMRTAASEYADSGKVLEEAIQRDDYPDDASRKKIVEPLEEAFNACQQRYIDVMTEATEAEGEQAALNEKLLAIVMELVRDVPGQEDEPDLRVTPDQAFQIIAYVGGSHPGQMLDDTMADALTGEEISAEAADPTPQQPSGEKPAKPRKPTRPRARKSASSQQPSPAPS